MKKQILSICMALALCLTLLPTAAFADEGASSEPTTPTTPTRVCATEGHIDADNDSKCDACNKAIAESGTWSNKSDNTGNVYGTGTWNLSADGTLTVLCDDDTVAEVTDGITTGIYKDGSVQNGSAVTTVTGATNATITTTKVELADRVKTTVVYKYGEDIKITVTSTVNYSSGSSITVDTTDVAVTVTATKDGYAVGTPTTGASGETIYKVTDSNITVGDNTVATVTAAVTDTAGGKQATIEIEKDSDTTQFTVKTTAVSAGDADEYVAVTTSLSTGEGEELIAQTETYVYASDDQAGTIAQTTTSTGEEGTSAYQKITIYSTGVLPDTGYDIEERLADVQDWYRCHDSVKKLVIGAGVTAIGVCNFCNCENLTAVVLPEGLKKISGGAFSNCTFLTGIDIPKSVTEIGSGAFDGCTFLTAINVTGNPNYEFKDGVLFRKNFEEDPGTGVETPDGTLTLHTYLCGNTASEYTIPEDVTAIEVGAFSSAAHLTALTLLASLGEINPSDCGLDSCEKLSNIYVSADSTIYTSIDGVLFKINTDDSGESGTASTTESSTASQTLTLLFYPRGRTASSYIFPENVTVTTIGEYAFQNTTALTSITIPDTVTAIGRAAFTNSGLTEITLPASVTDLGYDPVAPVYYFDGSAFEGTSLLTKFNVAEGNTTYLSIDGVLFKRNTPDTGTTAITAESGEGGEGGTVPVELTLLRYPGAKAEGLYTIPSQDDSGNAVTVTAIEQRSFEASRYLTSVSIPVGVKTIGFRAFTTSMNLVSVFLPASVEKIGALAFQGCFVLKDVYYADSVDKWQGLTVTDCNLNFESSDLDELRITPPEEYGSFEAMGDAFHGNWTIPLTNDFLLLGMKKDDISFQRTSPPTFHYESDGTVEITLDPNGGTLAEGTTVSWTVPYNTASSYTPPASTRSGYSFEGWTDTMRVFDWELGEYLTITRVWNWADPVYADLDLTAAWSKDAATYSVEVSKTIENGTVKVSPRYAERGDTVTITVTPDEGCTLKTITVTGKNGKAVELTDKGNGSYTFQMPSGEVTVSVTFAPEEAVTDYFDDVPANAYYAEAVNWAVKQNITGGIGNDLFAPDASCTRAQIVTFLWRAAGSPEPKAAGSFTDVPANAYYAKAVAWAVENGITGGIGSNQFAPDLTCTRAQAAAFLFRYAAANGMEAVTLQELVGGYADADQVPGYALSAFNWALAKGIVQGYNGSLMPNNDCTRAQIVTMLYRLLGE